MYALYLAAEVFKVRPSGTCRTPRDEHMAGIYALNGGEWKSVVGVDETVRFDNPEP